MRATRAAEREIGFLGLRPIVLFPLLATCAAAWAWPVRGEAWLAFASGGTFTGLWIAGALRRLRRLANALDVQVTPAAGARAGPRLRIAAPPNALPALFVHVPRWPRGSRRLTLRPGAEHAVELELPALEIGAWSGRLATLGITTRFAPVVAGRATRGECLVVPTTRTLPFSPAPRAPARVAILIYEPPVARVARAGTRDTAWRLWAAAQHQGLRPTVDGHAQSTGAAVARSSWWRLAQEVDEDAEALVARVRRSVAAGVDEVWVVGAPAVGGDLRALGALPTAFPRAVLRWVAVAGPADLGEHRDDALIERWLALRAAEGRHLAWLARRGWSVWRRPAREGAPFAAQGH